MAETFDAFHKWLGIPPRDQPPHHYRLLGVELFESDGDVIQNAADQRMSHVRAQSSGQHAEISQQILNQIAQAKICLLNPARRQEYDQQLKAKIAAAEAKAAQKSGMLGAPPPPMPAPPMAAPPVVGAGPRVQTSPRKSGPLAAYPAAEAETVSVRGQPTPPTGAPMMAAPFGAPAAPHVFPAGQQYPYGQPAPQPAPLFDTQRPIAAKPGMPAWVVPAGAVAGVLALVGIIAAVVLSGGSNDRPGPLAQGGTSLAAPGGSGGSPRNASTRTVIPTSLTAPGGNNTVIPGGGSQVASTSGPGGRRYPGGAVLPTGGTWIPSPNDFEPDWLSKADPRANSVFPGWQAAGVGLEVSERIPRAILGFPGDLPEQYEMTFVLTRTGGSDAFAVALKSFDRSFSIAFDAVATHPDGPFTGIEVANNQYLDRNPASRRGRQLPKDERKTLLIIVRKSGVTVKVDGQPVYAYAGDYRSLQFPIAQWTSSLRPGVYIASRNSGFEIEQFMIQPVTGDVETLAVVQPGQSGAGTGATGTGTGTGGTGLTQTGGASTTIPASMRLPSGPSATDLLSQVDLRRDSLLGRWTQDGATLVSNENDRPAVFRLPKPQSQIYRLHVLAQREKGTDGLVMGLFVGDRRAHAMIDGFSQQSPVSGFEMIRGATALNNPTTSRRTVFADGQLHRVMVDVGPNYMRLYVDGRMISSWSGDPTEFSGTSPGWESVQTTDFYLGSWSSQYRVLGIVIETPTGQPGPRSLTDLTGQGAPRTTVKKLAMPSEEQITKATSLVKDLFKDDFTGAKQPAEKVALANKLMSQAAQTTDDPAAQFVLYREASELAAQGARIDLAFQAIDQIGQRIDTPVLPMKTTVLRAAQKTMRLGADLIKYAESCIQLLNEAILADEFDLAEGLGKDALDAARRAKDTVMIKKIQDGQAEIKTLRLAFQEAETARDKLKTDPNDPAANSIWGRFLCLAKGDFETGVPLLAKGSNEQLAAIAKRDAGRPSDPNEQAAAGDGWWDLSDTEKGLAQRLARQRAVYWYERAMSLGVAGLSRAKVEKRLQEFAEANSDYPIGKAMDVLGTVDLTKHTVAGNWGMQGGMLGVGVQSSQARVMIPVGIRGDYDLEVKFLRTSGNDDIFVIIPIGDRQCMVVLSGLSGSSSGISYIDNDYFYNNVAVQKNGNILNGRVHILGISVRVKGDQASIDVGLNGAPYIRYAGALSRLSMPSYYSIPNGNCLGVGAERSVVVFQEMKLKMSSGLAKTIR